MRISDLLESFNIDFASEGHKHCRLGWVNMKCPFCEGNPGLHLGYNLKKNFFYCWRCGWHPPVETISKLIGIGIPEVRNLITEYGGHSQVLLKNKEDEKKLPFQLPSGTRSLSIRHKQYLEKRGFESERIEWEWELKGTGPVSMLDRIDYKLRIIIPISWNGKIVSFQARDITNKSNTRYKSCPKARETIFHKSILYGKQSEWENGIGICVEGPTDVWKLGRKAFSLFGISYKQSQINLIAKTFSKVFIIFDNEPQATIQAEKLSAELKFSGVKTSIIRIENDPGAMNQNDADYLIQQLLK